MRHHTLAIILARAGSKGLPGKNALLVAGRPMVEWTILAVKEAQLIDAICISTDLAAAAEIASSHGVYVIDRPAELATDTAAVADTARHAIEDYERNYTAVTNVVILYGNIPVRPSGVIDRAIDMLDATGADSVRSVSPVGKFHPDWMHRLDGNRLLPYRSNSIHRRQDLEPLFYHDGAVIAVTRKSLFNANPNDPHAFFGEDRRGVLSNGWTIDIDNEMDLRVAEVILLQQQNENAEPEFSGTAT